MMNNQSKSTSLKPCPFCGGTKFKIDCKSVRGRETYSVRCNKCHARGGTYGIIRANRQQFSYKEIEEQRDNAKQKAIEAWNRRATEAIRNAAPKYVPLWVYETIAAQPTAYDIDKVVEQLEQNVSLMRSGCKYCFAKEDCDEIGDCGTAIGCKMIEIVKGQFRDITNMVDMKGGKE